ncbi:hypothetical protein D3C86_2119150 [compost metagenome]
MRFAPSWRTPLVTSPPITAGVLYEPEPASEGEVRSLASAVFALVLYARISDLRISDLLMKSSLA